MTSTKTMASMEWSCDQIDKYRDRFPNYQQYAETLHQVLDQAVRRLSPYAIVQTRPKAIASFAEKIQRKWPKYNDPVNQFTDLCGGRVITFTQPEVKAVCEFVLQHFEIDWENSVDISQRLKPSEFGYRSVHYIVKFKPNFFPNQVVNVTIPDEIMGLKAEIQVRTLLEHAWAGFGHDRVYKSVFAIPRKWQRELAGVAAMLEQADETFSRVEQGLQVYAANYGAYMTEEEMYAEMELLENVLACDPDNPELTYRIGKLAMTLGNWLKAIEVFERYQGSNYQPILRDLGVSLCKLHQDNPQSPEYQRGQQYLQQACSPTYRDPDALASLAGTWKDSAPDKARNLYRQAFEIAPTDPYAVGNYLAAEITYRRDTSAVSLMAPAIATAMQRCRDQVDVGMNLPWAYYDLGTFHLALNQPYESLQEYARAIQLSPTDWFLETSLQTLTKLDVARDELMGYDWVTRLFLIALAGKFRLDRYCQAVMEGATPDAEPLSEPIVILAGSCDASVEEQMRGYLPLLLETFSDFKGTVISGGTTAGIAGLAGDIQETYPSTIYTIGHIPALIPPDVTADGRYRELRQTAGHDFNALGPLQIWADIVVSGINPRGVKLVGVGGGKIAAAEYRIALALGAEVAILEGSGRSASRLLIDDEWNNSENLTRLPADAAALKTFLLS